MPNKPLYVEARSIASASDLLAMARVNRHLPSFFWENPSRGLAILGLGAAVDITAHGSNRFAKASRCAAQTLRGLAAVGGEPAHPIIVGGFAFSGEPCVDPHWREFPPVRFFLPQVTIIRRNGQCRLITVWQDSSRQFVGDLASELENHCGVPSIEGNGALHMPATESGEQERWSQRVTSAKRLIASGALSKVVLARGIVASSADQIGPAALLARHIAKRPWCFNFWFKAGLTSLVGSSPELLVRLERGEVFSGALAGSAARDVDPTADAALGQALLNSPKNRLEHQLVVTAVRNALAPAVSALSPPAEPELKVLPEAQHLFTPVTGRLRARLNAIDLAGLLHPTPAVCGVPTDSAFAIIEREERWRGWYTGGVGWMQADGDGEFAVTLRSALIEGDRMRAWAGAGIVDGSDPQLEFEETEAKLTALLGKSE